MSQTQGPPDHAPDGACSDTAEGQPGPNSQGAPDIFDERFRTFMEGFGETCEAQGAELALAVVVDPRDPTKPIVFLRGNPYPLARLAKQLLLQLRDQVQAELT